MEGLNILEVIQKYDHVSQRTISKETGLSLGMVNLLIKKFLKVGLLKAEKLNGNKIKYILTPKGSQVLLEKTVSFVKRSFEAVSKISEHVEDILEREFEDEPIIYIDGDYGEVYQVVVDVARRMNKNVISMTQLDCAPSKVLYLDRPTDENGIGVFEGFKL